MKSGVDGKPEGQQERFGFIPGIRGVEWMLLDGVEYERTDGKAQGRFVYDPSQRGTSLRPKNHTFNVYEGLIAIVKDGRTYIAPHSPKREQEVVAAGYRSEMILMPALLSYEQISDPTVRGRFAAL